MTRRQLLSLPASAALVRRAARCQPEFKGVAYREYARELPDYLRDLAARAYAVRNREIAKLTSPGAIRTRQQWVRETFWKLAGGMPQRTPLNRMGFLMITDSVPVRDGECGFALSRCKQAAGRQLEPV